MCYKRTGGHYRYWWPNISVVEEETAEFLHYGWHLSGSTPTIEW